MHRFRAALAQIDPALGDVTANLELHLETARKAREAGADLVVFPELSLTGYVLRDQVPDVAVTPESASLGRLLETSRDIDLVVGFVEETAGHLFHNSAAYLSAGRVCHVHRKVYLPTYGMFDEGRDFAAGQRLRSFPTRHGEAGLLICEDAWHATSAWLLAQQGAAILIVVSSGPTRGAKPGQQVTSVGVWKGLLETTARFQTSFVLYVNRVGCEDGLTFGGGSFALDPFGRTIVSLPALDPGLELADLDPEILRRARTAYPLIRDTDLELVDREIERLRHLRYDLPEGDEQAE